MTILQPYLTEAQRLIVERAYRGGDTLFVTGPAGAGKSTAVQARLLYLLAQPLRGESILVLVPDRSARSAIELTIARSQIGPHGRPAINTFYGLVRQLVELFWPAVAHSAGFAHPEREPTFLTFETAQYLMHEIVAPLQELGYFAELRIRPRRLMSQLLDNLNKAAINGFPYTQIGERLTRADPDQRRSVHYARAQECASRFRLACLERNALDVSLTIDVFQHWLLPHPLFWSYFSRQFRHLVVDNAEETVPVAQDLINRLLVTCDSATLAYDEGGGYRILLGVDPDGARSLRSACRATIQLTSSFGVNSEMRRLSAAVASHFEQPAAEVTTAGAVGAIADIKQTSYRSEMIIWTAGQIADLVQQSGVRPADIAVICPYADGVLRFGLQEALRAAGIPFHLVRRWVSFRDDAVARSLLTLTALAHPGWDVAVNRRDLAEALHIAISGLDLTRAALLSERVFDPQGRYLQGGTDLDSRMRERVGYDACEQYERLQAWLSQYVEGEPVILDRFLARLFEEVLCESPTWSGDAGAARLSCARLIESVHKFREAAPAVSGNDRESLSIGQAYLRMVDQGIVAAQYVELLPADEGAVLLVTPAYAYVLENRVSDYQFWMDVGSREWWRPPHQPLTNPIVLSRRWDVGQLWDDQKDAQLRDWLLTRMVDGLSSRCRRHIYLCASDVDSMGNVQDGPLFPALARALVVVGGGEAA